MLKVSNKNTIVNFEHISYLIPFYVSIVAFEHMFVCWNGFKTN